MDWLRNLLVLLSSIVTLDHLVRFRRWDLKHTIDPRHHEGIAIWSLVVALMITIL